MGATRARLEREARVRDADPPQARAHHVVAQPTDQVVHAVRLEDAAVRLCERAERGHVAAAHGGGQREVRLQRRLHMTSSVQR
jgi:hypothetical protein